MIAKDSAVAAGTDHAGNRLFLVVVDNSDEWQAALRFAGRRAEHTGGRVGLLSVIEPTDFEHWMTVGDVMREEMRAEAEERLQEIGADVLKLTGRHPVLFIREGVPREQVAKLLEEEPAISILVLGAKPGNDPGPLVTDLVRRICDISTPVTIVPGHLEADQLDHIA